MYQFSRITFHVSIHQSYLPCINSAELPSMYQFSRVTFRVSIQQSYLPCINSAELPSMYQFSRVTFHVSIQQSYLPCINSAELPSMYHVVGLPISVSCPVYRHVNNKESLPLVSVLNDEHLFKLRMTSTWTEKGEKRANQGREFPVTVSHELREDTVVETKATLKVVRTRVKYVLIYCNIIESGQNKSKVCSYILGDRESNPSFITMDTSCKLYFKRDTDL